MLSIRPLTLTALVLITFVGAALTGCSHCPRGSSRTLEGPATILSELEAAYDDQDLEAYGVLLSDDFVWSAEPHRWGKQKELLSAAGMFTSPNVTRVSLDFPCGCRLRPGDEPDTWILDRIKVDLRVEATQDTFVSQESGHRIHLRRDPTGQRDYVVDRWEGTPCDDCEATSGGPEGH